MDEKVMAVSVEADLYEKDGFGINMTEAQLLSTLQYIDYYAIGLEPKGSTVEEMLTEIATGENEDGEPIRVNANGGRTSADYEVLINHVLNNKEEYQEILSLKYTGYLNDNVSETNPDGTGLVLATLSNDTTQINLATGSEGEADSEISGLSSEATRDWQSNVFIGVGADDPVIRAMIEDYIKEHIDISKNILWTGHSRGGAISNFGAIVVAAYVDLENISVMNFSGLSGAYSFTEEEKAILNSISSHNNYVIAGDFVPYIAMQIGNIIVLQKAEYFDTHYFRDNTSVEIENTGFLIKEIDGKSYLYHTDGNAYKLDGKSGLSYDEEKNYFVEVNSKLYYVNEDGRLYDAELSGDYYTVKKPVESPTDSHYIQSSYIDENGYYYITKQEFLPFLIGNLTMQFSSYPELVQIILEIFSNIESPLERDLKEIEEQKNGLKYVVSGAEIKCSCGLRKSKLLMPETKGVFIHDLPQADYLCNKPENIISFGGCNSSSNPSTKEAHEKVIDNVNRDSNFLDKAIKFIQSLFLKGKQDDSTTLSTYGECMFSTKNTWLDPVGTVFLEKDEALLRRSKLICKYEGIIEILHEGQLE